MRSLPPLLRTQILDVWWLRKIKEKCIFTLLLELLVKMNKLGRRDGQTGTDRRTEMYLFYIYIYRQKFSTYFFKEKGYFTISIAVGILSLTPGVGIRTYLMTSLVRSTLPPSLNHQYINLYMISKICAYQLFIISKFKY